MAVPSFLFGGSTGLTQEQLASRRKMLEAMRLRQMGSAPRNVGEGLTAVGQAIAYRMGMNQLGQGEAAAKERRDALMAPLFSSTPSSPPMVDPNASASAAIPDSEVAGELAATDPAPASFSGNQQEFIESILPAAIEEGKRTGVDPRIIVAQAAQETGWGRSAPGNNLFGIKSHGQSGGNSLMTTEYVDGRPVKVRDSFRAYENPADSVRGYGDFILQNPRYQKFRTAQGLDEQLAALQASGYATDPNYSRSVGRIARGIQLPGEVASLDPSAGMPTASAAIDAVAPPSGQPLAGPAPYRDPLISAPNYDPVAAGAPVAGGREAVANALAAVPPKPQQFSPAVTTVGNAMAAKTGEQLPALPPAQEVGPASNVAGAPMQQPQQVAGADYFPPAPPPPSSGPTLQQLYQISTSPDITEQDRALVNMMIERRMQEADPVRQMQLRKGQLELQAAENGTWSRLDDGRLYNQRTGEVRNAPVNPSAPPSDLGLNPQYGVDANGNPVLLQLGKDGKVVQSKMPDGVTLSKEPIRLDAGTHWVLLDPITRQPIGQVAKDNRGEAADTAAGKADAEARAALPQAEESANLMLSSIDSLMNDPYLDSMVGSVQGRWLPNVTSDAARVQSKIDQIGGQSFLQAYNMLRGGGQITEEEGKRATAAMGRLNTAQNEKDYREALSELRSVVASGLQRVRQKAGVGAAPSATAPVPSGPVSIGGYTIEEVN
ncbi:glucosaminidase domain-containing protein [Neorhizobium sp. DT-125]|uniref:glycoside hydrolase family 73 protein n=1 Tax=Neorhizobium sp. DT-125 TaxID=3396163 RepID=UPI003F1D8D3F